MTAIEAPREQTRARYPDQDGYVERDGVRIFYEVYGTGDRTVLLLPTWSIVHSRHWKAQIPYLARHARVVTFDGRGNGRSDRPAEPDAYREEEFAADALAVMDATATGRAVLVSLSRGAERSLHLAASHPERVDRMVFIAPALPLAPATPRLKAIQGFAEPLDDYSGWGKWNRHYWVDHYEDFLEFFFSQCFTEPHSTKQREDAVGWGLETDAETLVATQLAPRLMDEEGVRALLARIDCPILVIHGGEDAIRPCASGARLAELAGATLSVLEGSGHFPHARDPVQVNLLLRDFVAPPPPTAGWTRGRRRRKRALYVSSPIGLGHARRDIAIARELRLPASRPRDRLARPAPGDRGARGGGRARAPGQPGAVQRVASHRVRVGRARPALLPGVAADGRDPGRQLHGLPRPRQRDRLRPLDRRRGLGDRLLPAREPRAEARRLRLADRLRRLAADARRRRARGVPHRRLQRRDDRAHRALPARARPRDLRR